MAKNKEFASRALRVLAAAYKTYSKMPESLEPEDLEHKLVFIGIVGMIDPCRVEVYDAIKECRTAGIRPVMITGDHKDTAIAIGKDLGIIENEDEAIEGATYNIPSMPEFSLNTRPRSSMPGKPVAWSRR